MSTEGKVINCRAAVVWGINEQLKIENIQVDPPKAGEIRVKIVASGVCHSDLSMMNGSIEGIIFPMVLGHEGAGIVESTGDGVTEFKRGDHVIPLFMPQCRECKPCKNADANQCVHFEPTGWMPDGTSRLSVRGQPLTTALSCGTFSEYTVLPKINLCKINANAPLDKVCLLGCGVTTGYGAAVNTAKVKPGSSCAIWGLGALGLSTIMGCKSSGASRIFAIDINPAKFDIAKHFGATDFINPKELGDTPIQEYLKELTEGVGVDYAFEAIGNKQVLRQAFESTAQGYGFTVLIGGIPSDQEISVGPLDLLNGRTLKGTIYGHCKSIDSVPRLVEEYLSGKFNFDAMITHHKSLDEVNETFDLLIAGKSIRTVITM